MPTQVDFTFTLNQSAVRRLTRSGEVKEALGLAGQIVEAAAKRHVRVRTGNLRRSIYHEVTVDGRGPVCRIGTNVRYGLFQEIGTVNHPAYPYLRPALAELEVRLRSTRPLL